jgi:nickel-dependent lactate racemase
MTIGKGYEEGYLTPGEVHNLLQQGLEALELDKKRMLVIIPDNTRTMPMPMLFSDLQQTIKKLNCKLDFMVALGTHPALNDRQLSLWVGQRVENGQAGESHIYNHAWQKAETFAHIGTIAASEVAELSGGLLAQEVKVEINRKVYDYDQLLVCGPVFPHEVAGFSGGNKYFFPGIAGPEIINFTHWLGALVTNYKTIGNQVTPVRIVINRAADFIGVPAACLAMVVDYHGIAGLYCGSMESAWREAARLSGFRHIIYKSKPFQRVLSCVPEMYSDLWTAAKGMYKLEPVVADGGEIVIYAPHVDEVSFTHGGLIEQIGYHCRDYYLTQWKKFEHYPGGVLAHSTHLKGLGKYDPETGVETPRIKVTLATGISREQCQRLNLDYCDPATIFPQAWQDREDEGILYVPRAGETLYRLEGSVNDRA